MAIVSTSKSSSASKSTGTTSSKVPSYNASFQAAKNPTTSKQPVSNLPPALASGIAAQGQASKTLAPGLSTGSSGSSGSSARSGGGGGGGSSSSNSTSSNTSVQTPAPNYSTTTGKEVYVAPPTGNLDVSLTPTSKPQQTPFQKATSSNSTPAPNYSTTTGKEVYVAPPTPFQKATNKSNNQVSYASPKQVEALKAESNLQNNFINKSQQGIAYGLSLRTAAMPDLSRSEKSFLNTEQQLKDIAYEVGRTFYVPTITKGISNAYTSNIEPFVGGIPVVRKVGRLAADLPYSTGKLVVEGVGRVGAGIVTVKPLEATSLTLRDIGQVTAEQGTFALKNPLEFGETLVAQAVIFEPGLTKSALSKVGVKVPELPQSISTGVNKVSSAVPIPKYAELRQAGASTKEITGFKFEEGKLVIRTKEIPKPVIYRGLVLEKGNVAVPLVGISQKADAVKSLFGVRKIDVVLGGGKELVERYSPLDEVVGTPRTPLETYAAKAYAKENFPASEYIRLEEGLNIIKETKNVKSAYISKEFNLDISTLKPNEVKIVEDFVRKQKEVTVYGSQAAKLQSPAEEAFYTKLGVEPVRTPVDVDLQFGVKDSTKQANQLFNKLKEAGAPVKIEDKLISVQIRKGFETPGGRQVGDYVHLADIHDIGEAGSLLQLKKGEQLFGFKFKGASENIGGVKVLTLGEQTARKGVSSLTLQKGFVDPLAHRIPKDITGFETGAATLIESRRTRLSNIPIIRQIQEKGIKTAQESLNKFRETRTLKVLSKETKSLVKKSNTNRELLYYKLPSSNSINNLGSLGGIASLKSTSLKGSQASKSASTPIYKYSSNYSSTPLNLPQSASSKSSKSLDIGSASIGYGGGSKPSPPEPSPYISPSPSPSPEYPSTSPYTPPSSPSSPYSPPEPIIPYTSPIPGFFSDVGGFVGKRRKGKRSVSSFSIPKGVPLVTIGVQEISRFVTGSSTIPSTRALTKQLKDPRVAAGGEALTQELYNRVTGSKKRRRLI